MEWEKSELVDGLVHGIRGNRLVLDKEAYSLDPMDGKQRVRNLSDTVIWCFLASSGLVAVSLFNDLTEWN